MWEYLLIVISYIIGFDIGSVAARFGTYKELKRLRSSKGGDIPEYV